MQRSLGGNALLYGSSPRASYPHPSAVFRHQHQQAPLPLRCSLSPPPLRLLVKAFTRAWKLAHSQELTTEAKRAKAKVSLFLLIRHGISSVQSSTSLAIAHTYTRTDAFAATCAAPELRLPLGPLSCDLNPVPFDYHPSRASTRAGAKWLMKSRIYKAQ
jgi:hypothetical protein